VFVAFPLGAGQAMSEIANGTHKSKRKPRVPAGFAGERLVFDELRKRGFDAQLGRRGHEMLFRAGDSPPMRVHVKTANVTPWYVRRPSLVGHLANQVTVLVLLGPDSNPRSVRFFVITNRDLSAHFRQTANWESTRNSKRRAYGYLDCNSLEKYEDNWAILG
jgi:hypothetical protein